MGGAGGGGAGTELAWGKGEDMGDDDLGRPVKLRGEHLAPLIVKLEGSVCGE